MTKRLGFNGVTQEILENGNIRSEFNGEKIFCHFCGENESPYSIAWTPHMNIVDGRNVIEYWSHDFCRQNENPAGNKDELRGIRAAKTS
jgi:hypothetical protein